MTYDQSRLKEKLNELINQHSELDDAIERINEKIPFDQVKLQRLKKKKLVIKDDFKDFISIDQFSFVIKKIIQLDITGIYNISIFKKIFISFN